MDRARIVAPLAWTAAWSLAIAGALGYLLWPAGVTWWLGVALALPLLALAAWRAERRAASDGIHAGDSLPPGPP